MKTNEEFIQGVYGKRDALVKKRKKRMAFTATAVCAVLCVAAAIAANFFDDNNLTKFSHTTEIEQGGYMNQNGNEAHSGQLKAEYQYSDKVQSEKTEAFTQVPQDYSMLNEDNVNLPEIATEIAIEGVPEGAVGYDGEQEEGGAEYSGETVTMHGSAVIEPATEGLKNGNTNEVKPTMPAPSKEPMFSTEEIIEAAYSVIPEEEREFIIKDSANATVTRYADGRQEYEVAFQTTQDKYIKVKLDSELNPVWQGV